MLSMFCLRYLFRVHLLGEGERRGEMGRERTEEEAEEERGRYGEAGNVNAGK